MLRMFRKMFRNEALGFEFNVARHRKIIKFLDKCDTILLAWTKRQKQVLDDKKYCESYGWKDETDKLGFFSYFHCYFRTYADFMRAVAKDLDIKEWDVGSLDYCVKKYIANLSESQLEDALQIKPVYITRCDDPLESVINRLNNCKKEYNHHLLHIFAQMLSIKRELYSAFFKNNKEVLKHLLEKSS